MVVFCVFFKLILGYKNDCALRAQETSSKTGEEKKTIICFDIYEFCLGKVKNLFLLYVSSLFSSAFSTSFSYFTFIVKHH